MRTLRLHEVNDDKQTFRLWNLWLLTLVFLAFHEVLRISSCIYRENVIWSERREKREERRTIVINAGLLG